MHTNNGNRLEHIPLVGRYSDADCGHGVHLGGDEEREQHRGNGHDGGQHSRHGWLHRLAVGYPRAASLADHG